MRKLLKVLLFLLLLLLVGLILVPVLFKDRLVETIKYNVNASLNAQVDFGDFDLTLLKNFPDFTFQIEDITLDGVGQFDSLRLASLGEASFTLDIMSVIKGDKMKIHGIHVNQAYLNAVVLEDGTANYDIIKETSSDKGDTTDVRDEYVVLLEEYDLTNSEIIYDNRSLGAFIHIKGLNHSGDGELTDKRYDLNTLTTSEGIDLVYDGIGYLKNAETEIKANFDIQDDFRELNLKENEIRLNQLFLEANGLIYLPEDGVDMDLEYRSTRTELKSLLSLVPSEYLPGLEGLKTSGSADFSGEVKGHYDDSSFPGFTLNVALNDGSIQYPDLPENIEDIFMDLAVMFPGGGTDFNRAEVNIPRVKMNIAESPVNASLFLKNMVIDPYINSNVKAQLNLSRVKEAVALEGVQDLAGIITADVDLEGSMSAIEQERYSDFKAAGQVILQDFNYVSDSVLVPVHINTAHLNFNPKNLELASFNGNMGKTDISAQGNISNYLAYVLKDETIKGRFKVQSNVMDMNEFLSDSEDEEGASSLAEDESKGFVKVPGNVDFDLDASVKKLMYEDMELSNLRGTVVLKNNKASLKKVNMDVLGGTVTMDGSYETPEGMNPLFDFAFKIAGMDINSTASTFNTVSQLAPVAKQCTGDFSSDFNFSSQLDENMNPVYNSLTGGGRMSTDQVVLENFKPLVKIAEALSLDNWSRHSLDDIRMNFAFEDGKVVVDPFDLKIDGMQSTISGSMSFEQDLDYDVAMKIPVDKLGGQANQLIGGLVGQANSLGLNLSVGEYVNMVFKVTGKMDDPEISPRLVGQEGSTIKDVVKETIQQEVEEIKEEALEDVKEEAQEQADKLLAEAQKQSDALRAESKRAADKVRDEGYRAADKLVSEAKGPIAKAAARIAASKLKKETDVKTDRIEDEAERKARSVMDDAQKRADELTK